jgi:hypothetical protein
LGAAPEKNASMSFAWCANILAPRGIAASLHKSFVVFAISGPSLRVVAAAAFQAIGLTLPAQQQCYAA